MLLPIHIAAGGLAIVLGAVALSVKKGGTIHRRSGLLFVYAMLVMGTSASILGLRSGLIDGNVMGGLMTAYFVGTALTTVRPASPWTRRINVVAVTIRAWTRARRDRGRRQGHQQHARFPGRRPVSHDRCDVLHPGHCPAAGGGGRRTHHAIRYASRRAAPGAPSVAHVLRALHRGRLVLLDPWTRGENPARAVHDRADARAADSAAVWRDVLLVGESPRPSPVARARPTRFGHATSPTADYPARMNQGRKSERAASVSIRGFDWDGRNRSCSGRHSGPRLSGFESLPPSRSSLAKRESRKTLESPLTSLRHL